MAAPFRVEARCERTSIPSGKSSVWASIKVEATAKALEAERAPLAVALVLDVSGSMRGDPLANVLRSCEIVAELLDARDRLAIVTFAKRAGVRCGLTALDEPGRAQIVKAVRTITSEGGTNIHAGMEVAAGVLMTAPAGLRRVMVVLSDGQPNLGLSAPTELADYVRSLRPLGVSSLGFGIHHDEDVLVAIATAGSGRYAYIPDPMIARVDLARAALAHGDIVADSLELKFKPAPGVELFRLLPPAQLRHGGDGVSAAIGDVFVDELRLLAVQLSVDASLPTGKLAEISITGRTPDGARHELHTSLTVDVHADPHAIDREAQRGVLIVRAEAARADARANADRGAMPGAASLLRHMIQLIDASEAFARNDGSLLGELREQLEDEAANYERQATDDERAHQRRNTLGFTPTVLPRRSQAKAPGVLVGLTGDIANQRFGLFTDCSIGRSRDNEISIHDDSVCRRHARIVYVDQQFMIQDLGSTMGTLVNGKLVSSRVLADKDVIKLGDVQLHFRIDPHRR